MMKVYSRQGFFIYENMNLSSSPFSSNNSSETYVIIKKLAFGAKVVSHANPTLATVLLNLKESKKFRSH